MPKSSTEQDATQEPDLAEEIIASLERCSQRILDLEKRVAVLETDQRELHQAVRDSLGKIVEGMAEMRQFMLEHKRPRQAPATGRLN